MELAREVSLVGIEVAARSQRAERRREPAAPEVRRLGELLSGVSEIEEPPLLRARRARRGRRRVLAPRDAGRTPGLDVPDSPLVDAAPDAPLVLEAQERRCPVPSSSSGANAPQSAQTNRSAVLSYNTLTKSVRSPAGLHGAFRGESRTQTRRPIWPRESSTALRAESSRVHPPSRPVAKVQPRRVGAKPRLTGSSLGGSTREWASAGAGTTRATTTTPSSARGGISRVRRCARASTTRRAPSTQTKGSRARSDAKRRSVRATPSSPGVTAWSA